MTLASLIWSAPSPTLCLTPDSVHLWRAWLSLEDAAPAGMWVALSPEEHRRANDLQAGPPRQRFVASRSFLRLVLARYTGHAPAHLRFRLGLHGKPALSPEFGGDQVHFNLSHSNAMLLCAVSLNRAVGIDVEHVRPLPAIDRMAARILSSNEQGAWQTLPDAHKLPVFFAIWTRKEALVKGLGERLSATFARVDVSLAPGQQAVMLPGQTGRPDWMIYPLPLSDGYVGAVAVEGGIEQALHWQSYRFEQEF
jgi:4'-phosphopantetheinyl transferase